MKVDCDCLVCQAYVLGFELGRSSTAADALTTEAQRLGLYPPSLPRWEPGARVACTDRASAYHECSGTVREVEARQDGLWYLVDFDGWPNPCSKPERELEPVCPLCNAPASRHPSSL